MGTVIYKSVVWLLVCEHPGVKPGVEGRVFFHNLVAERFGSLEFHFSFFPICYCCTGSSVSIYWIGVVDRWAGPFP